MNQESTLETKLSELHVVGENLFSARYEMRSGIFQYWK